MTIDLGFFGLRDAPFNPTADPRFLHMTPRHAEALAQLLHGVRARKGFVLLTGEVGTGKTTLLHVLQKQLDDRTAVAFVHNSMLGFEGLMEYVLEDLGIAKGGESHAQRLFALQHFLTERRRTDQDTVLIIDEAQDLDVRVLEQVRLLSNFEAASDKLLQIVLAGQPELRVKLDLPELRQLKQRIGLRFDIQPLSHDEVGRYIRTRLRLAGASDLRLFTDKATARIARYSGGVPRLINTVCDHALLFAYADGVRRIDHGIVTQVIRYLEAGDRRHRWRRATASDRAAMTPLRWGVLAASAATALGVAGLAVLEPVLFRHAFDLFASSLTGLARSARAVFTL